MKSTKNHSNFLDRKTLAFLFFTLFFSINTLVHAGGKGPNGIYPITERYVLVADKSLPGIILVDLLMGTTKERLVMDYANPVCIASCPNCNFALLTGNGGKAWRINFKGKLRTLLENTNELNFDNAYIETIKLHGPSSSSKHKIDSRQCLVSDNGEESYFADLKHNAIYWLDMTISNPTPHILFRYKNAQPYGLSFSENSEMLVAMHKKEIWRIHTQKGRINSYNIEEAGCPGTQNHNPNLRLALDDPINKNALIILANNPKTHDAVIWRMHYDSSGIPIRCSILAGGIGRGPGWVDSDDGKSAYFSRPHFFSLLPDGTKSKIILSDMDNRSLRIVDLVNGSTRTVMYDHDRRLQIVPIQKKKSTLSCTQLQSKNTTIFIPIAEKEHCLSTPDKTGMELSYHEAKLFCRTLGARLCEPLELRHDNSLIDKESWTSAACSSCWLNKPKTHCDAIIKSNKARRSWYSGHAIAIGGTKNNSPSIFCSSTKSKQKAAAFCCADDF